MPHQQFAIPGDWDGDWACYQIAWPKSEEWRALLRSIMYSLARGRYWDANTGSVIAARDVGRDIYDLNRALQVCGDAPEPPEPPLPPVVIYCGGGDGDGGENEDIMPTKVWFDSETLLLHVEYSPCCEKEYDLSVICDGGPPEYPPDPPEGYEPPDPPLPKPTYYACGKASELVNRVVAIGHAAWDNRLTPQTVYNAIREANPGYSVSMSAVISLWEVMIGLSAIETVVDADIFDAEFITNWKCKLLARLDDDNGTLSDSDYDWFQSFPYGYFYGDGVPDVEDVYLVNFWSYVVGLILKRERCQQIALEGAGAAGDCSDCGGDNTYIGANGYYLSPVLLETQTLINNGWNWYFGYAIDGALVQHDVFGYMWEAVGAGITNGIKNYAVPVDGSYDAAETYEQGIAVPSGSFRINDGDSGITVGGGNVCIADADAVCEDLFPTTVWTRANVATALVGVSADPAADPAVCPAGTDIAIGLQKGSGASPNSSESTLYRLRLIYNINSPSHAV